MNNTNSSDPYNACESSLVLKQMLTVTTLVGMLGAMLLIRIPAQNNKQRIINLVGAITAISSYAVGTAGMIGAVDPLLAWYTSLALGPVIFGIVFCNATRNQVLERQQHNTQVMRQQGYQQSRSVSGRHVTFDPALRSAPSASILRFSTAAPAAKTPAPVIAQPPVTEIAEVESRSVLQL